MTSAIRSHLQGAPHRNVRTTRRSVTPTPARTWAWVAAGVVAVVFAVVLFSSSPQEPPKTAVKWQPLPVPREEPKPPPPPDPKPAPEPPRREEPRPEPPPVPEAPKPAPAPREEPQPPPPPPEPKPAAPEPPRPVQSQVVGIARIEKVEGAALVGKAPAVAGTDLGAGQSLETGAASRVVLAFPDKTQVELGPESSLTESGARLILATGALRADVTPQPKNKPLIIVTPHAEAKVLGTILRVVADRDPKKGTLLEVEKGRVELRR